MSQDPPTIELRPHLVFESIESFKSTEFHQKNPYNRGFLCGMIEAWNVLTNSHEQPPPLTHEYSDVAVSDGAIGYEAIKLLAAFPAFGTAEQQHNWNGKVMQLLETWAANATSLAMKAAIEDAQSKLQPVTLTIDGKKFEVTKAKSLYDIDEVQNACLDWPGGWNFNRLVAVGNQLMAEQINDKDINQRRNQPIGTLSANPEWLRVAKIS